MNGKVYVMAHELAYIRSIVQIDPDWSEWNVGDHWVGFDGWWWAIGLDPPYIL